jgi:signal transduction histidine kinase
MNTTPSDTNNDIIENLLTTIQKIASGDFSARATISGENQQLDAIIVGINMLAEELQAKTNEQLEKNEAILFMLEDLNDERKKVNIANKSLQESQEQLKETQNHLKQLNNQLEEKVINRTKEVNHLLHQKDEFINQISHDLRTPLTPLLNLIPLLAEKETDPKKQELFEILTRNTEYMKNMVLKATTLAQLNSSNMKLYFTETNLFQTVKTIIEKQQLHTTENHKTINNNIPKHLQVSIDQTQFDELISNILTNAKIYTNKKGTITITAKETDTETIISISDTGIGMTHQQIENVFDEFYKADWSRHNFNTSGLGLSICKRIIELHGGTIEISSPGIGKGTTVTFTIPRYHN